MSIIVSQAGSGARRLERTVIKDESYLQKYIYEHPDTLPLQEIKEDLKLPIPAREFPTPSGPIDALGIDGDGDIYLIETKLYKNPDKRLVLAQILDYGASLWRASESPDAFLKRLDEILSARAQVTLSARVSEFFSLEGAALTELLESVKQSATSGRYRFVVLMDRLDERLKDLISFINSNSAFDILGVGLDFYQHEGLDILIPTLYGAEAKKPPSASPGGLRRRWDSSAFFADADGRTDARTVSALHSLLEWASAHADEVSWGTGAKTGSFSAKFAAVAVPSVFSAYSNGELSLNFKWLTSTPESVAWARQFGELLRQEKIVPVPANFMDTFVYLPSDKWNLQVIPLTQLLERLLPSSRNLGA